MANGVPEVFQQFIDIVRRDRVYRWLVNILEGMCIHAVHIL